MSFCRYPTRTSTKRIRFSLGYSGEISLFKLKSGIRFQPNPRNTRFGQDIGSVEHFRFSLHPLKRPVLAADSHRHRWIGFPGDVRRQPDFFRSYLFQPKTVEMAQAVATRVVRPKAKCAFLGTAPFHEDGRYSHSQVHQRTDPKHIPSKITECGPRAAVSIYRFLR
jgi:hypothetical protein